MLSKAEQLHKHTEPKLRQRKCKFCRKWMSIEREGQETCSEQCAIDYVPKKMAKQKRKSLKQFRETDKAVLTKVAQQVFNKYIRERDKDLPCISCGHMNGLIWAEDENGEQIYVESKSATTRQRHAGHYRPTGRNAQLRFNEDNCSSQCSICNNHLSGNLVAYRDALILKIGLESVEALENYNEPKKYTVKELNIIIETYKKKYKSLV